MDPLLLAVRHELGRRVVRVQLHLVDRWLNLFFPQFRQSHFNALGQIHISLKLRGKPRTHEEDKEKKREREREREKTHLARRVVEQLLQVGDAEVGDADVADLAGADELLQLAPRVDEGPVVVVLLQVVGARAARPVHQVQVHVVEPEVLQRGVDPLRHPLVPRVVQLRRHPDLLPRHPRRPDPVAHLVLVAVGQGRVDVAVAWGRGGGCVSIVAVV